MTRGQIRWSRVSRIAVAALLLALLALGSERAAAELLTGLTSTGNLVTFDSGTPGTIGSSVAISGLLSTETLLGIDRRPATGASYDKATGAFTVPGRTAVVFVAD